jgi:hypothetical protein
MFHGLRGAKQQAGARRSPLNSERMTGVGEVRLACISVHMRPPNVDIQAPAHDQELRELVQGGNAAVLQRGLAISRPTCGSVQTAALHPVHWACTRCITAGRFRSLLRSKESFLSVCGRQASTPRASLALLAGASKIAFQMLQVALSSPSVTCRPRGHLRMVTQLAPW